LLNAWVLTWSTRIWKRYGLATRTGAAAEVWSYQTDLEIWRKVATAPYEAKARCRRRQAAVIVARRIIMIRRPEIRRSYRFFKLGGFSPGSPRIIRSVCAFVRPGRVFGDWLEVDLTCHGFPLKSKARDTLMGGWVCV